MHLFVYSNRQKGTYSVRTYLYLPIDIVWNYMYSTVLFIKTLHKKGYSSHETWCSHP